MTHEAARIGEIDLLAYADGLLDPDRAVEVEAYLARRGEAAARANTYAWQNEAIRTALAPAAREPVPPALTAALDRRPPATHRIARLVAVAVAVGALGGSVGWNLGQRGAAVDDASQPFVAGFTAAYRQGILSTAPVVPGRAASPSPSRISLDVEPPDLWRHGLVLAGEDRVRIDGRSAARLAYRDQDGHRVSIILLPRRPSDSRPLRIVEDGRLTVAYWLSGALAYSVVGDLPRRRLEKLASDIRGRIEDGAGIWVWDAAPRLRAVLPDALPPLAPLSGRSAVAEPQSPAADPIEIH